jgi:hypothetical protein
MSVSTSERSTGCQLSVNGESASIPIVTSGKIAIHVSAARTWAFGIGGRGVALGSVMSSPTVRLGMNLDPFVRYCN